MSRRGRAGSLPRVTAFHLAQLNIALPKDPLDAPLLADFVAMLDPVNARAEAADGFVWRLKDDAGDATAFRGFGDDRIIVNLSVWQSLEALEAFVYRDAEHLSVMRRRRTWFERLTPFLALWWVPAGHRPTVAEAEEKLARIEADGPTPEAFTFRRAFPAPDAGDAAPVDRPDAAACPA